MRYLTKLALALLLTVGVCLLPAFAYTEADPYRTDLIAGQHTDVGDVLVWDDGDNLYVKYEIVDMDWCITETHLQVAESLDGIPQTKKNNPIPGKFEFKDEHDCVKEVIYTYDMDGMESDLVIAAHASVKKSCGEYDSDFDGLEASLPDQVSINVTYPGISFGEPSYFDITISGGTILDGTYDGWCIDTDLTIQPGDPYTAYVYSSYEILPPGLVEYPENLDLVNWIINQNIVGQPSTCDGNFTYSDLQRSIWALLDDEQSTNGLGPWSQCRVDEILAAAKANGESFVPGCGDVVAIILEPLDDQLEPNVQIIIAEYPVPCIPVFCEFETAWGDGYDFAGKNWATYFTYPLQ